jgi:hypothetical protein
VISKPTSNSPTNRMVPQSAACKPVLVFGIALCAVLAVGIAVAYQRRRENEERSTATLARLNVLTTIVHDYDNNHWPLPRVEGAASDPAGWQTLVADLERRIARAQNEPGARWRPYGLTSVRGQVETIDGWGHPILFRSPGPIHADGWDAYSFGPNGIDEKGGGDDLIVGGHSPVGAGK